MRNSKSNSNAKRRAGNRKTPARRKRRKERVLKTRKRNRDRGEEPYA